MAYWKSRGLRGCSLETMINFANDKYRESKLALVQKIPTPIKPIKIDQANRHITLAYFEQKSTVDYIGVVQGIPICFDAKECATDTFSLQNIHKHQIEFMKQYEEQEGVAFIIVYYSNKDIYYYLRFKKMMEFVKRAENGGRKSFKFEEIEKEFIMENCSDFVCYLKYLQLDLDKRK